MAEFVKRNVIVFIYSVLILSTLLVFWQVRHFDFVNYDDKVYIYENPHVLNGLTRSGVTWAFTSCYLGYWQPLTWLSLMVDCQLFGALPGRIHLVNLFLHIANTLLLFWVLKKMTGSLWSSAFVAAAFALHPMHVESVAWIAERKDVLSTFFLLLTLAAYTGYTKSPTIYRYMASLVLFAFGLMAKPILVTVPFLLLLLDYWPLNRFTAEHAELLAESRFGEAETAEKKNKINSAWSPRPSAVFAVRLPGWLIIEKIPFLVLSVVSSIITFLTQKAGGVIFDTKTVPLTDRAGNAFLSYARYIGKLFVPQNLAVFYPFDAGSFVFWQVAMSIVLLIVISVLVIRFGRNRKFLPVGWFWFIGTLVPVIGLVTFTGSSYADRFTYIPYIGLFIMLAWGLPELLSGCPPLGETSLKAGRYRKIVLGLVMIMVLATLGIRAHQQVGFWKNSITLFSRAIEVTQNNVVAHNELGNAYLSLGRCQEAAEVYKQAIKIKPDNAKAYNNLGVAYFSIGSYQDAAEAYKQATKIKPDYAEAYNNLGAAYFNMDSFQDALESCRQAIKIKPYFAQAYYNLGVIYDKLGRWQDSIEAYKQAIKIRPSYADAHNKLGNDYLMTNDKISALEEYRVLKTLDAEKANELLTLINK
jgi:protein O-mannosyl-transferase